MNKSFKPSRKWTSAVKKVIARTVEQKQIKTDEIETTLSSASLCDITTLNTIVQGDDIDERIGNMVRGYGAQIKVLFTNASTLNLYVRLVLLSAQGDEFDATTDNFLRQSTAPSALGATNLRNIYGDLNKNEFNVHYDRVFNLAGTGATEGKEIKFVKKFVKFNHKLQYPSASTGESLKNNMRLLIIPVDALGDTAASIEFSLTTTYYYQDI